MERQRGLNLSRYISSLYVAVIFAACGGPSSPQNSVTAVIPEPIRNTPTIPGLPAASERASLDTFARHHLYVANTRSVTIYASDGEHVLRTITQGISNPHLLTFGEHGDLFVGIRNSVNVYARGKNSLQRTISIGSSDVTLQAIAIGPGDRLYVAECVVFYVCQQSHVIVYTAGGKRLHEISKGVTASVAIAFDGYGNLYVGNAFSSVTVYAPNYTLLRTIRKGVNNPAALLFDHEGDLFVANRGGPGSVSVYAPGTNKPMRTIKEGTRDPTGLVLGGTGNLFVLNSAMGSFRGNVTVYGPNSTKLLRTISQGINYPMALVVQDGYLYVANAGDSGTVTVYAPGSDNVLRTISDGVNDPTALAFGP